LTTEARSRYRRAVEWLARCLEFGAGARLGEDTSEAQVALAEAFVGLDERGRAWEMARAARDVAQKAGNQLDLASALAVMASVLWLKGDREEAAACAEDAAARFDRLGHPARAVKIRQGLKKKALFFPSEIEYYPRTDGSPQVRFSRRRERDMSSGRSLDLLCTNSLTSPRPLPLFADSARLAPTDAELPGIEV
jgi:hypothetical protein